MLTDDILIPAFQ